MIDVMKTAKTHLDLECIHGSNLAFEGLKLVSGWHNETKFVFTINFQTLTFELNSASILLLDPPLLLFNWKHITDFFRVCFSKVEKIMPVNVHQVLLQFDLFYI